MPKLAILAALALAACQSAPDGTLQMTAAGQQVLNIGCAVTATAAPVVVPIALAAMPGQTAATVQTLDTALVHPMVVKTCADLGGRPVSAAPVATAAKP